MADPIQFRNKPREDSRARPLSAEILDQNVAAAETGPERRRSERVLLDVALIVRGESAEEKPFEEQTFTISVSAHGALLLLATRVTFGQKLFLKNPKTQFEMEARVARFGSPYGGLAQVGIEFARPAPEIWPIEFPPDGWKAPAP